MQIDTNEGMIALAAATKAKQDGRAHVFISSVNKRGRNRPGYALDFNNPSLSNEIATKTAAALEQGDTSNQWDICGTDTEQLGQDQLDAQSDQFTNDGSDIGPAGPQWWAGSDIYGTFGVY